MTESSEKPDGNVVDLLKVLWRKAGYRTQDEFARACGYAGQQSMQRVLKKSEWVGRFYTAHHVGRFLPALTESAPRPIPAEEVWQLAAPEYRPSSATHSAAANMDFNQHYELIEAALREMGDAELMDLSERAIEVLSTAYARVAVQDDDEEKGKVVLREAAETVKAFKLRDRPQ